ncbi:MAG: FecR domain-containing protein, partial [Acidobacteria bacterium]|nr:FecR domain-containing protein [Acidobacteriota bacterium]
MSEHDDAYLWDGSGEPDPEIVRLERILGQLRHQEGSPTVPHDGFRREGSAQTVPHDRFRKAGSTRKVLPVLAAAAVLVLLAGAAWLSYGVGRVGWSVQTVAGMPTLDGASLADNGRLGIGKWLITDAASRARVSVGQIGRVDVDPNTQLQLVESRGREHRMALARGTIHARIWAPPKFFYVNTPSAVAVDLGCAYSLQVDDTGAGLLHVTAGWVAFETEGRESFIPAGAVCVTRPGVGPGTPRYEDAPSGYAGALTTLDFGADDDPGRAEALNLLLSQARPRDA